MVLPGSARREVRGYRAAALALAAERAKPRKLDRVRTFTDAQAAIAWMTHDEPAPVRPTPSRRGRPQQHCAGRTAAEIEIRWCTAHEGILGNEIADGSAKLAPSEPDDHRVEWLVRTQHD